MGASWNEYKIFSVYLLPLNPLQVIGVAITACRWSGMEKLNNRPEKWFGFIA